MLLRGYLARVNHGGAYYYSSLCDLKKCCSRKVYLIELVLHNKFILYSRYFCARFCSPYIAENHLDYAS